MAVCYNDIVTVREKIFHAIRTGENNMRTYINKKETKLAAVVCNCCKKELLVEKGILKEECIHVSHDFGYFSKRDGETHSFDLCEDCYDKLTEKFLIPAQVRAKSELL